ncbi:UNKNOWN [Stylonychia lemnae]|uniref:Uncharacterized protein n=1 Tax=Stylonychia lemnae TaxID=5949 RepID=A0A078B4L2_STYLE|nr:UNKNOWN [Stylonychia lemnae]|eukprot:CDW89211.1 UNKNOWN [Stylonychia lemnae]
MSQARNKKNLNSSLDNINYHSIKDKAPKQKHNLSLFESELDINQFGQSMDQSEKTYIMARLKDKLKKSSRHDIKFPSVLKHSDLSTQITRATHSSLDHSPYVSSVTPHAHRKNEGAAMFETVRKDRETEYHLVLMENRIKKLQDEEIRAQKKIQETLERTQRYQRIQDFKNQLKNQIQDHKTLTERQTDDYRKKLIQDKIEKDQRMKELKDKIRQEKAMNKEEIDHSIHVLIQRANLELDDIQNQKRDISESIKQNKNYGSQMRKDQKLFMELERTEQYMKKHMDTQAATEEKNRKIAELSVKEMELLQRLQHTKMMQEQVMSQYQTKTGLDKKVLFKMAPSQQSFMLGFKQQQSSSMQTSPREDSRLNLLQQSQ